MRKVSNYKERQLKEQRKLKRKKLLGRSILIFLALFLLFKTGQVIGNKYFLKYRGVEIDSLSLIDPAVVTVITDSLVESGIEGEKLGKLAEDLKMTGLFTDVDVELKYNMKIAVNLKEAPIIGTYRKENKVFYVNSLGRIFNSEICRKNELLPEFKGIYEENDQVYTTENFTAAVGLLRYLVRKHKHIHNQISSVSFNEDDSIHLLMRNSKIINFSKNTDTQDFEKFAIVFADLYDRKGIDLIDLRFGDQIITRKL